MAIRPIRGAFAALLALCLGMADVAGAGLEELMVLASLLAGQPDTARHAVLPSIPLPGDANVETSFYAEVSMPFWRRHIVDSCASPEGRDAATSDAIREIRMAIARSLATGRRELVPTALHLSAERLWNAGCRDAGVSLLHFDVVVAGRAPMPGEEFAREVLAAASEEEAPVIRFLLAGKRYNALMQYAKQGVAGADADEINKAIAEYVAAFGEIAGLFREADPRIAETLDVIVPLPPTGPALLGNDYFAHCRRAEWAIDTAFYHRGPGWASEVTEEGWEGWRKYTEDAETNFLAALEIRPDGPRALMGLARLYGCTCHPNAEVAELFSKAVSNSLDNAAPYVDGVLQFQSTRWGGSLETLLGVASNAAATVRTDSDFAWITAAAAVQKIANYEVESLRDESELARIIPKPVADEIFAMFDKYIAAGDQPFLPPPDLYRCMGISFAIQMHDWKKARAYTENLARGYGYVSDAAWLIHTAHPAVSRDIGYFLAITYVHSRKDILAMLDAEAAGDHEAVLPPARRLIGNKGMTPVARGIAESYEAHAMKKLAEKAAEASAAEPAAEAE